MLYRKEKEFFLQYKEMLLTSLVIIACLLLSVFYPVSGIGQQITAGIIFLIAIPALYVKLILHKSLGDFGVSLQNPRVGFFWAGLMLVASLATALLLFHFFGPGTANLLPRYAMLHFGYFLLYELLFVGSLFFLQEFFFKGFVLFTFRQKFSLWSVVFSVLAYLLLLAATSGLVWGSVPFMILSVTGGIVAYKSRSLLYSYIMGLTFLIFFDAYLIYILK